MPLPEPAFAAPRPRRALVSLTPLIDVVFILLLFFMLATAFVREQHIPLTGAEAGAPGASSPVQLYLREGDVRLAGAVLSLEAAVAALVAERAAVVLDPAPGVSTQRLADALTALRAAGLADVVLAASR